jgi:hypothetical protein
MSPVDRPVPPAGEEIHIPGGSLHPLLLTVGITVALLGVTINWILCVIGGVLAVVVLWAWIRGAADEYQHLPLEHHAVVADTVTNPDDRAAMETPARGDG